MLAAVMERVAVVDTELFHRITNAIRWVCLQITLINIKHLVKTIWDMEAQRWCTVDVSTRRNLLVGKPTLIGKCKLQLITVELLLCRA